MSTTELGVLYRELKQSFNSPRADLKAIGVTLAKLKVGQVQFFFYSWLMIESIV